MIYNEGYGCEMGDDIVDLLRIVGWFIILLLVYLLEEFFLGKIICVCFVLGYYINFIVFFIDGDIVNVICWIKDY